MRKDNSIKHADEEMESLSGVANCIREEYRESVMQLIRLSLIEAYRKGWNDAEQE